MFLHVCVCPQGEGLPQCMMGYPPWQDRPPGKADPPCKTDPPLKDRPPTPLARQTPPVQCILGHTVNKRVVCILVECNLVKHKVNELPLYTSQRTFTLMVEWCDARPDYERPGFNSPLRHRIPISLLFLWWKVWDTLSLKGDECHYGASCLYGLTVWCLPWLRETRFQFPVEA